MSETFDAPDQVGDDAALVEVIKVGLSELLVLYVA